jgi:hypothetical protein
MALLSPCHDNGETVVMVISPGVSLLLSAPDTGTVQLPVILTIFRLRE